MFWRCALERRERTLGPDHPHTLTSVNNLGQLLQDQGKFDLAEPFLRRALEGNERTLGLALGSRFARGSPSLRCRRLLPEPPPLLLLAASSFMLFIAVQY